MSTIYHHRGRVAALSRSRASDDPEFIAAKTDLVAANIADYLIRTLAAAPPLTDEQRTRLAELLPGRGRWPAHRPGVSSTTPILANGPRSATQPGTGL
ncbi:phiRv1 phage protein [Mycobacterium tuberculosis]|nr:phiRv1 phage protein [Mycobacterium tuberculosis]